MKDPRTKGLKPHQRKLLEAIIENSGRLSLRGIAQQLRLNNNGVSQTAGALHGRGLIRYHGHERSVLDQSVYWVPPVNGEPGQLSLGIAPSTESV